MFFTLSCLQMSIKNSVMRIPAQLSKALKITENSISLLVQAAGCFSFSGRGHWAILHLATAHENITCFQDGQECELSDQNLVETAIVTNWQECSLLCLNSTECYAFTFFGQNSDFLPHNSCLLFSSCRTKLPCNDCVIGKPQVKALES